MPSLRQKVIERVAFFNKFEVLGVKEHCGQLPHEIFDFKCGNSVLARISSPRKEKGCVAFLTLYSDCHDLAI